jgi:hypothetical protein
MTAAELIIELQKLPDQYAPLTATFSGMFEKANICVFSSNGLEYRELFIPENLDSDGEQIIDVIEQLKEDPFQEIILTFGNEERDILSTKGGVEFKDGELFVNTETCPQQV